MSEQKREPPAIGYTWARAGYTIDAKDVRARFNNIRHETLWRWIKIGRFPKPLQIGGQRFWLETVIEDFMRSKAEAA